MPHRYQSTSPSGISRTRLRPFAALRDKWKEGYSLVDLRHDLMAGIVVGMVAVPLGMALAIASGVPPQHGLYTVIVGGALVALLGGSRFQVTGPTAAFVVILAPIAQQFGLPGLLISGLMAGILLIILGLARLGRWIQYIPYPVTTGFTAGIAVVIATLQLKDFLGLKIAEMPEGYFQKWGALFSARATVSWPELGIALLTLFLLLAWPRVSKRVPAPLFALTFVSIFVAALKTRYPGLEIATVSSRFHIPESLPLFTFPWLLPDTDGQSFQVSLDVIQALIPSAFAISILGAIESLLSAVVADGMARTKHDPDAELIALGTGNIICPFFGGIAATGAIARTATNIRFGAKSPISAVIHSIFALLVVAFLAPWIGYLPMAALAALLMLVAYNMSEIKHFLHILRVAPASDVTVLLLCFSLTVVFDMVVGVTVGVVLAALLFMRRMAETTSAQVHLEATNLHMTLQVPNDVLVYEIAGPLFFGAAESAVEAISGITDRVRTVIFVMKDVPVMDVTGLVALESAIRKLTAHDRQVYLVGVRKQPMELLARSDLLKHPETTQLFPDLQQAIVQSQGQSQKRPEKAKAG